MAKNCPSGKHCFADELSGKIALARRVWKDKGEKRCYKCNLCRWWHLTSEDPRNYIPLDVDSQVPV